MATTTNYGWTTPDDTALVKDGAAAIRTLGSSVDTSVKALNPGTTAGDLDYYTAATTKARIAKGTAGQVFTMNSGATAPEWATSASGGMTLISTTTLTGASVTLSSIPSTYNHLQFVVVNLKPATDGDYLILRFNGDSGANRHASIASYSNSIAGSFNSTSSRVSIQSDNTTATGLLVGDIPNYANSTTWKTAFVQGVENEYTDPTKYNASFYSAFYNQTAAISSLQFLLPSGNFTSGSILLYGVK